MAMAPPSRQQVPPLASLSPSEIQGAVMTTTIKILAHCASSKEVHIKMSAPNTSDINVILQDGESNEQDVYDNRVLEVKEVEK